MPNAIDRVEQAESRLHGDLGLVVDRRTLPLDRTGIELRVLGVGDSTGAPLVLLAGEGQLASTWAPLLAELPDVAAIACDLPGFGASSGMTYTRLDLRALAQRVVTRVLDEHGLESATLAGSTTGGALALWAAASMPERVAGVALFGCPAPAAPGCHLPAALVPVGVPGVDRVLLDLPLPPYRLQRLAFEAVYGRSAVDAAPAAMLEAMHHSMDRPSFGPAMTSLLEASYGLRRASSDVAATPEELAAVTVPTLLLWGQHDRYGGPRVARRLVGLLPDARLELMATGHAPWWDHAAACADILRAWMGGNAGSATTRAARHDGREDSGGS